MTNHLILSSSSITSDSVRNRAGENLGNVKDIMIDMDSGNVSYVVVSFGGFLGIGDKYFAVPMEAFSVDTGDHHLVLDVDKSKLENAPGFDKDNWPTHADNEFISNMHSHFGTTPRYEYNTGTKSGGTYETRASERGYETGSSDTDYRTRGTGSDYENRDTNSDYERKTPGYNDPDPGFEHRGPSHG
jgi:sporulation protein YlmC with PRC-barrel domain